MYFKIQVTKMNICADENFYLARKLLIMVKNAGSKIKCGRLMKNMKPWPNNS